MNENLHFSGYARGGEVYFQQPLVEILHDEAELLAWLEDRAAKLYARKVRYGDAL